MRDEDDSAFRDIETTQSALRKNIEESTRLIDQAEDAIQRYRERHYGESDAD